jgi:hypothetical protein
MKAIAVCQEILSRVYTDSRPSVVVRIAYRGEGGEVIKMLEAPITRVGGTGPIHICVEGINLNEVTNY